MEYARPGALTRAVWQLRRAARLATTDPLRLLPADPLAGLTALEATVATLADVDPFEALRVALAPAPAVRRGTTRASVHALTPASPATRSAQSLAPTAHRSSGALAAESVSDRAADNRVARVAHALADRRRAIRRSLHADPNVGVYHNPPLASAGFTGGIDGERQAGPTVGLYERPRTRGDVFESLQERRAAVRAMMTHAPADSGGETRYGGMLSDAVGAATERPDLAEPVGPSSSGADLTRSAPVAAARPVATADAAMASPPGRFPRSEAIGARTTGADTVDEGSGAMRPIARSVEAVAHKRRDDDANRDPLMQLTDNLFEALYRDGVDLSWP